MGFHVIALKNLKAADQATKLTDLLTKRATAIGGDAAKRDVAVVQADERSNSLIVVANDDVFNMVDELVLQQDVAPSYAPVATEYRQLRSADAVKIQQLIDQVFQARRSGATPGGSAPGSSAPGAFSIIADTRSNSLLLTGSRDDLAEAGKLIESLDQSYVPGTVFKARKVRFNSAANIATLLQTMIQQTSAAGGGGGGTTGARALTGTPIRIASDAMSDTLLLAAASDDMAMLEIWIEELDKPPQFDQMTRIIPLRKRDATTLSQQLQGAFGGQRAGAPGVGPGGGANVAASTGLGVTITPQAETNSLIVWGPPALLDEIESLAKKLDEFEPTQTGALKIFKLQQTDAANAGQLLDSILQGNGTSVGGNAGGTTPGGAGGSGTTGPALLVFSQDLGAEGQRTLQATRQDISVIADVRNNRLVVMAPLESMPLMESIIAAIDVPPNNQNIRVLKLRHSDAQQMVTTLQQIFVSSQGGTARGTTAAAATGTEVRQVTIEGVGGGGGPQEVTFTSDSRTNSVICTGTVGYLNTAEQLVFALDKEPMQDRKTVVYTPGSMPPASLVQMLTQWNTSEQQQLTTLGADVSAQRKAERQVTAISTTDSSGVVVSYDPRIEDEVLNVIHQLDQPAPQVSIEVLIVEVTLSNALELGVEFAAQDLQYSRGGVDDTTNADTIVGTDVGAAGAGLGGFTFTVTGRDFNFLLRTLQSESALRVISRPHVVATANQQALVSVTKDVPYINSTSTTTGGQITTSVGRQPVGITLTVTPQISPDGVVRLEVDQKVDSLTNSTVSVGQGLTAPIFQTREAKTVVSVRDNETVVLGGLISTTDSRNENKIPFLGDIPVLGAAFRYDNNNNTRSELLVILTPRVIRTVEDYRDVSILERDSGGLLDDELIGDPLMRGLQVTPEAGRPGRVEEITPPYAPTPVPTTEPENAPTPPDLYGPLGDLSALRAGLHGSVPGDSYDLPVPLAAGPPRAPTGGTAP
jgi:type II secretory pathway component GspD/PulD (secretin)